jgi:nucleotide-binding universal stress UspA family protein
MLEYKNILMCTDFSEDADFAFLHALNLAKKYKAKLHVIHIPHSPYVYARHVVDESIPPGKETEGQAFYSKEIAERAEKTLRETYEKRLGDFKECVFHVTCGAPDIEIIRYAKQHQIDLIVMGALGKSDPERLERGSTVASVSKYAHCHVMAIRNPAKQYTLPGKMR